MNDKKWYPTQPDADKRLTEIFRKEAEKDKGKDKAPSALAQIVNKLLEFM